MPENNERNKEKTFLRQENVCACAGTNSEYQLPLFKCDTSSAEGVSLGAMVKATSNDVGKDVSNSELLVNSSNTQQTAKNENNITRDWSDLDKKDPCFGQKISNVQIREDEDSDLDIVCVSKTTLNGVEERWKNINCKDFAEGPKAEKNSGMDVNTETYFKRGSSKQNVFLEFENQEMVITEQQVTQIETLKLTNAALKLDNELNTEEEENASCCINKQALLELTKSHISNTEKYGMNSASDAACARKDSFLKARITSINTQRTVDDNCEIYPTLFDEPLMFPRQPNVGISLQKEPPVEKGNENEHCLADVTGYSTDTGKTSLNDKWKGKPSDSSVAATSNQQFHIVAKTHPDGGWGWVVCLGAFLAQFIVLGMQNTAGIVYTELVKELKSPRGATGEPYTAQPRSHGQLRTREGRRGPCERACGVPLLKCHKKSSIIVRKKITCGERTTSHISQNVAWVQIRRRSSLSGLFSALRIFSDAYFVSPLSSKTSFPALGFILKTHSIRKGRRRPHT